MASLVVSTFVFFRGHLVHQRYLDAIDIPKGLTRSAVIFSATLLISYGVAVPASWLVSLPTADA